MAYNLPPPWDPGFALPDNVRDEGLEKRGFVTKQMPRGWYDDPSVGTGGYAVPEYVLDEGYGQGTFTTKWEPRGEYDGPALPPWMNFRPKVTGEKRLGRRAEQVDFEAPIMVQPFDQGTAVAMSGTDVPPLFQQYGNRAASAVIGQVTRLPKHQRSAALKTILGKIDPTLWPRTEQLGKQYMARGLSAGKALHAALSQSMARGVISEAKKIGSSRSAPQANSLLGLGCYGAEALGATAVAFNPPAQFAVLSTTAPQPSATGTCPVGQTGYSWVEAAGTVPAHWERTRVGQPAQYCGSMAPSGPPGGVSVTTTNDVLVVGPGVELPINAERGSKVIFADPSIVATHPDLATWIRTAWTQDTGGGGMGTYQPGTFPPAAIDAWMSAVGITPGMKINLGRISGFSSASYKFTHPIENKPWGVWIQLSNLTMGGKLRDPALPMQLWVLTRKPQDPGTLSKILSTVSKVTKPVAVYGGGVVASALDLVADLGCQLINNPNAVAAAGSASGGAAAGGMLIAQQTICTDSPPPPPPPLPPPPSSNLLTYALIGGGVLAAVAIMTNKKKTA